MRPRGAIPDGSDASFVGVPIFMFAHECARCGSTETAVVCYTGYWCDRCVRGDSEQFVLALT